MAIRVASAPVSWGIMESVELPPEYPYSRVLDEIAQAGYAGTELGPYGFLPTEPIRLRQELDRRGLTLCSAFVAMHLGTSAAHEAGFSHVEGTVHLVSQAGCGLLILSDEISAQRSQTAGRTSEAHSLSWTKQEWKSAERAIGEVMTRCRRAGLRVAFHHHVGTHVETPEEVERLFSIFSPDELGLCLDTGHCYYGGGDPLAVLERYADRVRSVHLKDVDAQRLEEARRHKMDFHEGVRHGVFVPLGKGAVNFSQVLALLRKHDFDGWVVVEQDVLAGGQGADSPLANAIAGREFLRRVGI